MNKQKLLKKYKLVPVQAGRLAKEDFFGTKLVVGEEVLFCTIMSDDVLSLEVICSQNLEKLLEQYEFVSNESATPTFKKKCEQCGEGGIPLDATQIANEVQEKLKKLNAETTRKQFECEADLLIARWKLENPPYDLSTLDEYKRRQLAIILENQRLYKEISPEGQAENFVPLVYETFKDFLGFDIVSVQSMLSPAGLILIENVTNCEALAAKTRKLKTRLEAIDDNNLKRIAKSFREEITREIFTDLRNNVGTAATCSLVPSDEAFNNGDELFLKIQEVSGVIHVKSNVGRANWLVMDKDAADCLVGANKLVDFKEKNTPVKDGVYYWGDMANCGIKIIVDTLCPPNQILLGCYQPYNTGYYYCPYLALAQTVNVLFEESVHPGWLTRYGKKLLRHGSNWYANLRLA